jgi:ATP-dependent RNA helicase DDX10/DBP4
MFERQNQDVLADHYKKLVRDGDEAPQDDFNGAATTAGADDEDFMAVKRRIPADGDDDDEFGADGDASLAPGGRVVHLAGVSQPLVIDSNRREKLLSSKKGLTKLKDRGTKLVFDDEGNAHEPYELETEADFKARGLPEDQRQKFLEGAREVVQNADMEDKATVKAKRREKMQKRKDRERTAIQEADEAEVELPERSEDLLANFLADAQSSDEEIGATKPAKKGKKVKEKKKAKKWFESDSEDEEKSSKKRRKKAKQVEEPETLEDMEALAAGLLG